MHRSCNPSVLSSLAWLAVMSGLLAGCSAAPHASSVPAATSLEWLALTSSSTLDADQAGAPVSDLATPSAAVAEDKDEDEGHGFVHTVLLYIPNRIFDVLDIVRLRLRLGPGFAFDARATEVADVFVGAYTSVFVGIPGPRGEPFINWPFGIENKVGAELSVADASTDGRFGPHYGAVEFGVGVQAALIGLDVGVDPWEVVDFAVGLLTFDPVHDDL